MDQISIYEDICRKIEIEPGTPYRFQNIMMDGWQDTAYLVQHHRPEHLNIARYARAVADALLPSVEAGEPLVELTHMLGYAPLLYLAKSLQERLNALLAQDMCGEDALYRFGLMLAKERAVKCEVQCGMLILGLYENDMARAVLRTLGLHSTFTATAVLAIADWRSANPFLFDLAQHTDGYGSLAAICRLHPVADHQRTWLFEHGMDCAVARHPRSIELMRKPDMLPKYTSAPDADLQRLSRLLAYAAITQAYRDQPNSLSIVEHYMRRLHAYPMDFITIAAVSMIRARITLPLAPEPDADGSPWPLEDELEIKAACDAYLQTAKQNPVKLRACVRAELRVPKEDSALMMETLEALELYCAFEPPMFDDFLPLLEADAFDLSVMYYTLVRHPKRYAGTAYNRIRFPAEVFGTLEDGDIDDISDEYKPDAWLACLLLALRKAGHHVESYYLHCLSARFPDARIEALHGLRAIRTRWTGAVQPALARALAVEPAERIKRRIRRLMDAASGAHVKERRYIEIARVKPRTVDETLLFTTIAGAYYRDLSFVADQVAFGDVLLLQREPDNTYDKNAILVAAEDGFVLGYIPRTESAALAARMDAGEALYAILHDDPEYGGRPSIEIKRSHPIEQKGNIVTFPGGYGNW